MVFMVMAIFLVSEILSFKIPVEISYLIPVLFVVIPLFVFYCRPPKIAMYVLVALTFSYSFLVNPDFLGRKYNAIGVESVSENVGIYIRHGVIIHDVLSRGKSERTYWPESHK